MDTKTNTALEPELVDELILQQMVKDTCADIMPTLIEHYIDESRERVKKIQQALTNQDKEMLEFEVHTLGSSALALGNRTLSRHAREIERHCVEGDSELAFTACHLLPELAEQSFIALNQRKERGFED
ncbi:Hpt domain-containing protein [Vibrio sp. AND4]|uniref:Hpt domain-containing protein n=1 Tax=Vibrio sp. AND4 TaxID=314289 RepID=UPI00015EFA5D|nr:Hpt domain-containing protein [Vibrio sp. AND4]EDP60102.1 phosphorelay protein [Vibrio sp. AND4]